MREGGTPRPVRTFKLVIVICTTENCDDMPTSYILVLAVILMPKTPLNVTTFICIILKLCSCSGFTG